MLTVILSLLYLVVGAIVGIGCFVAHQEEIGHRQMEPKEAITQVIACVIVGLVWPAAIVVGLIARAVSGRGELYVAETPDKSKYLYNNGDPLFGAPEEYGERIKRLKLVTKDKNKQDREVINDFEDGVVIRSTTPDEVAEIVEEALLKRLSEEKTLPDGLFRFAFWLDQQFTREEMYAFDVLEQEWGEDKANEWLQGVLVKSGKYSDDGLGGVQLQIA